MDVSSGERKGTFNDGHHYHYSLSLLVSKYQSLPRDIACDIALVPGIVVLIDYISYS